MNQRDHDRRSGHSSERDDNRREQRAGTDRRWSNERDEQDARADRRVADHSDRFAGPGDRTSHEYGWNNERNWNDERNDWERHDDGVRAHSSEYGQDRWRPYSGERMGPARGYDQSERTFRQSSSAGALPRGNWEHDRNDEQRSRGEHEHHGYGSPTEQGFGAAQYGYGPAGYGSSGSNSGYGNRGERWQGSAGHGGERGQGGYGGERWQGGDRNERGQSYGGDRWRGAGEQGQGYGRNDHPGGRGFHGVGSYFGGNHGSYDSPEGNYGSDYGGPGAGQRGSQRSGEQAFMGQGQRSHRGVGPAGYSRSDERIKEDVSDALTDHEEVDAKEIEVSVKNGEVTLSGSVDARYMKRLAEDIAERVRGVRDVRNEIRVKQEATRGASPSSSQRGAGTGANTA
ncbi:MAG TPA: BON domain-containing protein, partial [Polyangiaceae bacterium]|nr:BON domain-containing protein [Polyangiaceae bacterium]